MSKKILVWLAFFLASSAYAQFNAGQVLTAAALNNQFSLYVPLTGGTLTGPLSVPSLNVSGAITAGALASSSLSTSNATITGGTISGLSSPVPLASGGTGSNTATGATENLQYLSPYAGASARTVSAKFTDTIVAEDYANASDPDDTGMLQRALNAAIALGGGNVELMRVGTYIVTGLEGGDNVTIEGKGKNATVIKLAANASAPVIDCGNYAVNAKGINVSTPIGCQGFRIKNLTIDGNKSNQINQLNGVSYYGIAFGAEHVEIKNASNINLATESPGALYSTTVGRNLQYKIRDIEVHDGANGNILYNGQSDSTAIDVLIYNTSAAAGSGSYNLKFGSKASGARWFGVHCWGTADYGWINAAATAGLYGSHIESAGVAKVWMQAAGYFLDGRVYEASTLNSAPAFLIDSGISNVKIDATISNTNIGVQFNGANGGSGSYRMQMFNNVVGASPVLFNGTLSATDTVFARLNGSSVANIDQIPSLSVNGSTSIAGSLTASSGVTLSSNSPRLTLNDSSGTNSSALLFQSNSSSLYSLNSTSSAFQFGRYSAGVLVDYPFSISNSTGIVSFVDGITVKGVAINPNLSGTSSSIGGGALAAGACTSSTVSVPGATSSMAVAVSPAANPGTGFDWNGYVSAAGTVTVNLCAIAAGTPTATTYNVRVIQ